uniref:Alpha-mannosidase n=1 Tax=Steinernema glaseri TaxID=37863 RepID=A0A1I7ZWD1_9BILA
MRCMRSTTIGLIFAVAAIYSVVILFVGDERVSFHSVLRHFPQAPRSVEPPVWVSVEREADADLRVDGTRVELRAPLVFNHSDDEPITVHLVLHSHVDPGWLETFDQYYEHKVHNILNLAVAQLTEHEDLRFIWSEVSFLERWWTLASEEQKKQAKRLVAEGRLEVCGGSWVMTDEATPYFWASIDNLIEGQRFLTETFNVTPRTSWSVDPFGHGSMIPYLLPLAGIDNMVIGRINNELKKDIRQKSLLTLNWQQSWTNGASKDSPKAAFVNVLPNKYYTTSDACGPDLHVCCQFDIGPTARSMCHKRADDVSPQNVAAYAEQLAEQYRKLSKFYRTSSVLVPIGDDFFFSVVEDWTVVYKNYKQLLDYINSNPKYKMNVRFSNVGEFFASVDQKTRSTAPLLSGDFFPYLDDSAGPYPAWTGYYAHLPYHKRMGRIVEEKLRSLDLLRLASGSRNDGLKPALVESRRNLALFQHHDGITGTSRKHVMQDFLQRLYWAFDNVTAAQQQLFGGDSQEKFEAVDFLNDDQGRLLTHRLFQSAEKKESRIVLFNPLTIQSTRRVVVRVNSPKVRVLSGQGKPIQAQILPQILNGTISSEFFDLLFFMPIEPLSRVEVSLSFEETQPPLTSVSRVHSSSSQKSPFERLETGGSFIANNSLLKATFFDGKITQLSLGDQEVGLSFELNKYADRGGAYVFVAGERVALPTLRSFFYVDGPLCRRVFGVSDSVNISHAFSVFSSGDSLVDGSLDLEVLSNVRITVNENYMFSLGTRAIGSNGTFYTDANGLHMMKRRFNSKESVAMNFYPAPSAAFLEDRRLRLSLLTNQPTAVASLASGFFEFMVDRQLSGDDGKGLSFGEADTSLPSRLNYRILLEPRKNVSYGTQSFFHSALGFHSLQDMLYPVTAMVRSSDAPLASWPSLFQGLLPCDVELVTFRFLTENTALALLRRLPFDAHSAAPLPSDCSGALDAFWNLLRARLPGGTLFVSNLTGTQKGESVASGRQFAALFDDAFLIRAIRIELP